MTLQPEFQAVVLAAGRGSRMSEITTGKPKCLLPVGPRPLVWYPLRKLQAAGFLDAILVVLESQRAEIQAALDRLDLVVRIEYCPVEGDDLGTADSLRLIGDRLRSDVIVVSCDLISDGDLGGVVDLFRMHDASIATLMFRPQQRSEAGSVPGPKSKHKQEKDIIGIDDQTNRLVFLASASDFERELSLPTKLVKKHTNIKIYSNLIDSHVYVLKNWVIKYLKSEENFMSIKGDLLPHIVKKQLLKPPKPATARESVIEARDDGDIFAFAKEDEIDLSIREVSSYNDHLGDLQDVYQKDNIRCYAHLAPKDTIGIRVNTLNSYWNVNAKITEIWPKLISDGEKLTLQHPTAVITSNQVDDKCIIWENAKLHEKTSFKNSIIGANSEVHSFSRVFNSIVMNNVRIKERVALENCIISDNVTVESGCQLKGCLIGSNHVVPEGSEHINEVLTISDRLMEF